MLELDPFNSMAIGLNRLSARGSLLSLPQAQGQTTLIAPPPLADMQSFETVCSAGNPEGIVAFCEGRLATYPFWLDLDRQAALAYGALGSKATSMREAIVDEVLTFLKRLPGVERLTFSDGTPFADDTTKAWIATCQAERAGGAPSDRFGEAKQRANAASGSDGPEAGIIALQEFISNTRSGRDQFRARLVLAELAMGLKRDVDAQPFVDPLLEDCVRLNLAYWEPELALAAWSLKLRAARAVAKQLEDSPDTEKLAAIHVVIQNALQQVSTLDFAEAMRQI
jgi:type VI secretion system protein VasJ